METLTDVAATVNTPLFLSEKRCTKCNVIRRRDEFHRNASKSDGLNSHCKACRGKDVQAGEKERLRWRQSYYKHREKCIARKVLYNRTPKGKLSLRRAKLKQRYGLSELDYDRLLASQSGRCAICKSEEPGGRWDRFAVDHCHETGVVRGLLCIRCNRLLGRLGDTLQNVEKLVTECLNYLKRSAKHKAI